MALAPKLSYAGAQLCMDGFGGSASINSGKLCIYDNTSSIPTEADDSNGTNVLLAELTLNADAFQAADAGSDTAGSSTIIANSVTQDSSADATGTANYARIYNSGKTTCYFQGTVGTSSCDFIINNTSIQSGGVVSCSSLKLRLPRHA